MESKTYQDEPSNKTNSRRLNIFKVATLALSITAGGFLSTYLVGNETHRQYAIRHLDSNAVFIRQSPNKDAIGNRHIRYADYGNGNYYKLLFIRNSSVGYGDSDNDGDYESILSIRNSDKWIVKLFPQKGLKGRIEFLNLSEKAVDPLSIPSSLESSISSIDYKDIDRDGKYESILHRKNSDGTFVDIPIEKGLEGTIEFPTIAATALNPLQASVSLLEFGITDYTDIDGDGKLESLTYFKTPSSRSMTNVEVIKGKYVLNPL